MSDFRRLDRGSAGRYLRMVGGTWDGEKKRVPKRVEHATTELQVAKPTPLNDGYWSGFFANIEYETYILTQLEDGEWVYMEKSMWVEHMENQIK